MSRLNAISHTISNTPGTSGGFTVLAASSGGFLVPASTDDGAVVKLSVSEGNTREILSSTYTHSTTSWSRGTIEWSTSGGSVSPSRINFTSAAVVQVVDSAGDFNGLDNLLDPGYTFIQNNGSTTQSLAGAVSTKIAAALTTVTLNPKGWWSTSNKRFTPTRAGLYMFIVGVQGAATSVAITPQLFKNGSFFANGGGVGPVAYPTAQSSFMATANGSTDYFELYAYASSATTTEPVATNQYFQAVYMGP